MDYKDKGDYLEVVSGSFERIRETIGALKTICFVPELNGDDFGRSLYKTLCNMEDHFRISESFVALEKIKTDAKNGKDVDFKQLLDSITTTSAIYERLEQEKREREEHEKG